MKNNRNEERLACLRDEVDANAKEYAATLTLDQMLCRECKKPMVLLESLKAGVCMWCRPTKAGGSQPATSKTEATKHVGISDVFCCHVERAVSALKYRRDALLRDMEGMPQGIAKVMDEGRENDVRAIDALEEWLQQNHIL